VYECAPVDESTPGGLTGHFLSFEAAAEEQQIRIGTHLAGAGCSGAFATFSFSEPILPVHAQ